MKHEHNKKRNFSLEECKCLGNYVYALRDPRNKQVFYVGQGSTDVRPFDHFDSADDFIAGKCKETPKLRRIAEIWKSGNDVEWFIIARNLNPHEMDIVESACFNVLTTHCDTKLTNETDPLHSTFITPEELEEANCEPVNPEKAYEKVFIFPIENFLEERKNYYEATRKYWDKSEEICAGNAYAVGIIDHTSVCAYKIENWEPVEYDGKVKWQFVGKPDVDLVEKRWTQIIELAKGDWQQGQYLVVEFDGKGRFKFLRGNAELVKSKAWKKIKGVKAI